MSEGGSMTTEETAAVDSVEASRVAIDAGTDAATESGSEVAASER